jgi:phage baseplate assembly protein gpV
MIQQGQTSERDVNTATARVAMDDLGGLVSGKMQVLFPAIGGWNMFFTPKEGDHVVISRLPNGQEEGYILGKVYTGKKMPQGGEPNIILLVSDDGKNVIKFDADKGTLDLVVDQDASIMCKNVNIEVSETATIKAKNADISVEENAGIEIGGNANIEVTGDSKIKANKADIEATAEATISSPKVTIDSANAEITGGNLTTKGTVAPTGSGAYCGLPYCVASGAPQSGPMVAGT